ncbi:MAG: hypothetical protein ACI4Q3_00625 [Kiritimatiellia bacterium]
MAKFDITVNDDPQKPLQAIKVGRGSVFEADIHNVPDNIEELQIHVGRIDRDGTFTPVSCIARSDRRWYGYVPGLAFLDAGKAKYHITGVDTRGGSHWLGSGALLILPSVLQAESAPIVPEDTYLRNPSTGLWHRLTATVDTDGTITPVIETEGITR